MGQRPDDNRGLDSDTARRLVSRRGLIGGAAAAGVAVGTGAVLSKHKSAPKSTAKPTDIVALHGPYQAGITTALQNHLNFISFDLQGDDRDTLQQLLRAWAATSMALTQGRPLTHGDGQAPADTQEADGLGPGRLTITFGLGVSLFEKDGRDRLGLRNARPAALRSLPAFGIDALRPELSGGDLGVQICCDDPMVALHAKHSLIREATGAAEIKWSQTGFVSRTSGTPRNTLGFKDGTRNLDVRNEALTNQQLWANRRDGQAWMAGGSYMVLRRIRTLLDVWDQTSLDGQQATIGRVKSTGAPLGQRSEHDQPDVRAGSRIPSDAHMKLAAHENNGGTRLLRRSFNYDDGLDEDTGQLDLGLVFICFQRDPHKQFVRIQRALDHHDALGQHLIHTSSALFACPPGYTRSGYPADRLFDASRA